TPRSFEPPHLRHSVKTGRALVWNQPFGRSQRATRKRVAAGRDMCQLDALAADREIRGVLAHDVAHADGVNANLLFGALAGHSFAPVNGDLVQAGIEALGDRLGQAYRSAAGRIDLLIVMRFD